MPLTFEGSNSGERHEEKRRGVLQRASEGVPQIGCQSGCLSGCWSGCWLVAWACGRCRCKEAARAESEATGGWRSDDFVTTRS